MSGFGRGDLDGRSPRVSGCVLPTAVVAAMETGQGEERLLADVLLQARVEDSASIVQLLHIAGLTASNLLAATDAQAEERLHKAGLLVGDSVKIAKVLRGLRNGKGQLSPRSHGAVAGGRLRRFLCWPCTAVARCLCGAAAGVARRAPCKPTIKCGLVVYSTTVLIVTMTVLSFYLPALLYQVRNNHRRIGSHFLQPAQANFLMPVVGRGMGANIGRARHGWRSVMMVTANQPLPCTTRRGDWIMELALRNKLMYATLHDYKTWWSTELVSAWDLEAAWNKIPLLYILMHPESPVTQGMCALARHTCPYPARVRGPHTRCAPAFRSPRATAARAHLQ